MSILRSVMMLTTPVEERLFDGLAVISRPIYYFRYRPFDVLFREGNDCSIEASGNFKLSTLRSLMEFRYRNSEMDDVWSVGFNRTGAKQTSSSGGSASARTSRQSGRFARFLNLFVCLFDIGTINSVVVAFAAQHCFAAKATKVVVV